jgi:hypothetical protein
MANGLAVFFVFVAILFSSLGLGPLSVADSFSAKCRVNTQPAIGVNGDRGPEKGLAKQNDD